ncbi:MAG: PTS sugar transporter subunit IIC [Gemmatimonadota bacterium]
MIEPLEGLGLAGLGAVVFLDQWPAVQAMVSRPLVVGSLAGLLLGAPADGALWGAVFEVAFLAIQPVGAARYPDAGLAALAGTTVALVGLREVSRAGGEPVYPAVLAVAVALGAGALGEWAGGWHRRRNGVTAARVQSQVAVGDLGAPGRAVLIALARGALIGAVVTLLSLIGGLAGLALAQDVGAGLLSAAGLRLPAVVVAAVVGVRLFLRGPSSRLAWVGGAAGGAALAWLGSA